MKHTPILCCALFLVVIAGCEAPDEQAADETPSLRISGVNIIDVEGKRIIGNQDIIIENGRIAEISDHNEAAERISGAIVDAGGAYAVAGLYDAHTHIDTAERLELMLPEIFGTPVSAAEIDNDLVPYMAYGVTGIVELGGNDDILAARERARQSDAFMPRIKSASPILDGAATNNPAHKKITTPADGVAAVNDAAAAGHDFIKIYGQLDIETRNAIIARAVELGMPVSGHLPQEPGFAETIVPGFSNIAHAEEITRFWDGEDQAYFARAVELMAENNVSLTPNLVAYREIADEVEDIEGHLASMDRALTPPLARVYASPRFNGYVKDFGGEDIRERAAAYFRRIAAAMDGLVMDAHRADVPLLAGTDAGNPTMFPGQGLYRELSLLKAAGLDGYDALAAATINVAKLFGEEEERGSIAVGKIADMVLFDINPVEEELLSRDGVFAVVKDGVLFDRARIDSEIARVSKNYDMREAIYLEAALANHSAAGQQEE